MVPARELGWFPKVTLEPNRWRVKKKHGQLVSPRMKVPALLYALQSTAEQRKHSKHCWEGEVERWKYRQEGQGTQ
eukprot:2528592-Ditylum_brightwellii.AAC.1